MILNLPNVVKVLNVWFLSLIRISLISQANQEIQLYQILVIGFGYRGISLDIFRIKTAAATVKSILILNNSIVLRFSP